MTEKAVIYAKADAKKVLFTGADNKSVAITGLAPATVVADGDYLVAITDDETGLASPQVAVPGFTVKATAPEAPAESGVKSTATSNGAAVTMGE